MEQTKYEQKVRERAEEFATAQYKKSFYAVQCGPPMPMLRFNPDSPIAKRAIDSMVEHHLEAARLSIQREAEAYRKAADRYVPGGLKEKMVMQQLQSLGLVP